MIADTTKKPTVYFIVGPTASGKTAVSIDVAKRLDAEIVSADSIQIYKGLDIGSAKPTEEEKQGVRHHLMDFVESFDATFNVAKYRQTALSAIDDIVSRGKKALVVGGTGLYVNSLIFPLNFSEAAPDDELRARLASLERDEAGSVHRMLAQIDPETAARLHTNDTKRIIRAIEIYERTGRKPSESVGDFTNERGDDIPIRPVLAGITMDRSRLYERIEKRIDIMLDSGLVEEVDRLIDSGVDPSSPAMQGLGYKQLIMYKRGEIGFDEAVELIKRDTRRFAKRQISWFKRDKRIRWFDAGECFGLADSITEYFIEKGLSE